MRVHRGPQGCTGSSSLRKMLSAISPRLPRGINVFREDSSDGSEGPLGLLPVGKRSHTVRAPGDPRVIARC